MFGILEKAVKRLLLVAVQSILYLISYGARRLAHFVKITPCTCRKLRNQCKIANDDNSRYDYTYDEPKTH